MKKDTTMKILAFVVLALIALSIMGLFSKKDNTNETTPNNEGTESEPMVSATEGTAMSLGNVQFFIMGRWKDAPKTTFYDEGYRGRLSRVVYTDASGGIKESTPDDHDFSIWEERYLVIRKEVAEGPRSKLTAKDK